MTRFFFGLVVGFVLVKCVVARAELRPIPVEEWNEKSRLYLVRLVQIEGGSEADNVAQAYVLAARWRLQRRGWDFAEQVRRYSYPVRTERARSPRQRWILSQTWDTAPASTRALLERWSLGLEANPCPGAVHWAGPSLFSPLPVVTCSARVFNTFRARPPDV